MYRISEENAGELRETMKKVKDVKAYRRLEQGKRMKALL